MGEIGQGGGGSKSSDCIWLDLVTRQVQRDQVGENGRSGDGSVYAGVIDSSETKIKMSEVFEDGGRQKGNRTG